MPSIAVVALLLMQPAISEQATACRKFEYTDDVRRQLVVPELVRRLGSLSENYDVERVTIDRREGGAVDLLIPTTEKFAVTHLDPPDFEIRLIDCGGKLYGSRWLFWPGTGVTGEWVTPDQPWPKPAR